MLRLAQPRVTPPGGYRFVCEETKQKFSAPHMEKLIADVAAHR